MQILIIDATAFIAGFNFNLLLGTHPETKMITTPNVFDEASKHTASEALLLSFQEQGMLEIRSPEEQLVKQVNEAARTMGDLKSLSENDRQLIALALEMKTTHPQDSVQLMSDDYSVQNTCSRLKIACLRLKKAGIKKAIRWEIYCPDCFMTYSADLFGQECERCGAVLKRRPYKGKRPHL